MIRPCESEDFESILAIINDGATAYRGVIPADRLRDPYMSAEELQHEISNGVRFYGDEVGGALLGVMGVQHVQDVTLIRHAYVRTTAQGKGVGGRLLEHIRPLAQGPLLLGTWADSYWAIGFYQRHGFRVVTHAEKEVLLRKYWNIPERQVETSIVFADGTWPGLPST
ncbi:sortase-like acyltransferase [Terriglobus roseus DSM 18391]|uniref:Sortase-like acyltransferase n=1 Tax=Terriglobus roseus (strain DSM 18391 / NRRL B-41598 / KBS 63) TaxID=926566 RepID=I3ZMD8_TERRK|nr:GNAT family N-acetyltransferase [Terriglobus roseus]AFL90406.1 sortase-like acyltransferase [Terriglobus roseus DSM 18391]